MGYCGQLAGSGGGGGQETKACGHSTPVFTCHRSEVGMEGGGGGDMMTSIWFGSFLWSFVVIHVTKLGIYGQWHDAFNKV